MSSLPAGMRSVPQARGAADWLCLAATPIFAIMALLTYVFGGGVPDALCLSAHDATGLTGMVPMYGVMSALHLAPWLGLFGGRGTAEG
jgi:hypothetical protein